MYVRTGPATKFESEPDDPPLNTSPRKTVTPLNAGLSDPGRFAKITTSIKAYTITRTS